MCAGKGMAELSLADRATIANMSPEYGATMGFFPVDKVTLDYLRLTGRDDKKVCYRFLLRKCIVYVVLTIKLPLTGILH